MNLNPVDLTARIIDATLNLANLLWWIADWIRRHPDGCHFEPSEFFEGGHFEHRHWFAKPICRRVVDVRNQLRDCLEDLDRVDSQPDAIRSRIEIRKLELESTQPELKLSDPPNLRESRRRIIANRTPDEIDRMSEDLEARVKEIRLIEKLAGDAQEAGDMPTAPVMPVHNALVMPSTESRPRVAEKTSTQETRGRPRKQDEGAEFIRRVIADGNVHFDDKNNFLFLETVSKYKLPRGIKPDSLRKRFIRDEQFKSMKAVHALDKKAIA